MGKLLTLVKEACQYLGIILLACGAAMWLELRGSVGRLG